MKKLDKLNMCFNADYCVDEKVDGSVTVFFSLIMLLLIAFLLTVYDHTRLQILQLEAMSNFQVAASHGLSQYDPVMFQEYGLLAGVQGARVEQVFDEHLNKSFYPSAAKEHDYIMDYILNPGDGLSEFMGMEPVSYEYDINYTPYLDSSFQYPKKQILEYMNERAPYILLSQRFQDLDIFSKTTKTSKVIEDKNELVSQLDQVSDYKKDLYLTIDGIHLYEDGSWNLSDDGSYVRSFSFSDNIDYSYFPLELRDYFDEKVLYYDEFIHFINDDLDEIEDLVNELEDETLFEVIQLEVTGEVLDYLVPQPIIQEVIDDLQEYQGYINDYEEGFEKILELREIHQEAIAAVENYELSCSQNIKEISEFQNRAGNEDELLESVVNQVNSELNQLKSEMTVDEINLSLTGNLVMIKEQLNHNLELLNGCVPYLEGMVSSLDNYIYRQLLAVMDEVELSDEEEEVLRANFKVYKVHKNGETDQVKKSTVMGFNNFIETFLKNYEADLLFDYREINSEVPLENIYEDKEEKVEQYNPVGELLNGDLLDFAPEINIEEGSLPSHLYYKEESGDGIASEAMSAYDLDLDSWETILLNGYIIEMFSNVSKKNDLNGKSLNGFDIDEHFLNYEAEYVIGGSLDEKANVNLVLEYIYGFRILLNIMHLTMDQSKRTMIMNIANTIAGWWTGGVGAIIIAVIITGVWAVLEAVVDVFLLTSNERVPLVKTASTWVTSPDGNVEELFNAAVRRIEDESTVLYEESVSIVKEQVKGFKSKVDEYKDEMSDVTWDLMEDDIEEFEKLLWEQELDIEIQRDMFSGEVNTEIQSYLDLCITTYLNNPVAEFTYPELNCHEEVEELAMEMAVLCMEEIMALSEKERTLKNVLAIKEDVLGNYENQLLIIVNRYQELAERTFETVMAVQMEGLVMIAEEGLDNKMKLGKLLLHETADQVKEDYMGEMIKDQDMDDLSGVFVPEFSYEDYLAVILFLPIVDNDMKVARVMDLVQMNIQKKYDDYSVSLADYYVGFEVEGKVIVNSLFATSIKNGIITKQWELEVKGVKKIYD